MNGHEGVRVNGNQEASFAYAFAARIVRQVQRVISSHSIPIYMHSAREYGCVGAAVQTSLYAPRNCRVRIVAQTLQIIFQYRHDDI